MNAFYSTRGISYIRSSSKFYPVSVFPNDIEGTKDIQSVVNSSLNVSKVHVYFLVFVYLKNSKSYLGSCCLRLLHDFL